MAPLKRRSFLLSGAGVAAAPQPAAAQGKKNLAMHVGGDYHSVAGPGIASPQNLDYNLRYGVRHLTVQQRGAWNLDDLRRMREACDTRGVTLEAIRMDGDYIALPNGSERDRALATILANIEKASKVGVKILTYHWTVIPIRRNRQTKGRGNATYAGFQLESDWQSLPVGKAGRVTSDDYWERITHFLRAAVPVAKQYDVRLACHPYDPPGLPFGYQGADNWDSPSVFDAFKRYEAVVESPYNGFQLCLGTTAEGLKNPRAGVLPIVEYLAKRGKIHQVHMRNIRGGLGEFEEVFPDEGDMDFVAVMRILRDSGFSGSILPDHMPRHPDDPGLLQSFAFGYGYIKALIQAVNAEV
jgi:mannonate dehydratase